MGKRGWQNTRSIHASFHFPTLKSLACTLVRCDRREECASVRSFIRSHVEQLLRNRETNVVGRDARTTVHVRAATWKLIVVHRCLQVENIGIWQSFGRFESQLLFYARVCV